MNALSILVLTAALASAATDKPPVPPFDSRGELASHGSGAKLLSHLRPSRISPAATVDAGE